MKSLRNSLIIMILTGMTVFNPGCADVIQPADPEEKTSWKDVLKQDLPPTLEHVLKEVESSTHFRASVFRGLEQ